MSLDVYLLETKEVEVYKANITHNLGEMAREAGIYQHLWRPEELHITKAKDLIIPLQLGLEKLKKSPAHFKQFDAKNGWGTYEHFVPFVEKYLEACQTNPEATVMACR